MRSSELGCTGSGCTCSATFGVGFVQTALGTSPRNFEVVVPSAGGGIAHYYRENATVEHVEQNPWWGPGRATTDDVTGLTLIESTGDKNLEVVATIGNTLAHYWRDHQTLNWGNKATIASSGVAGQPGFVQASGSGNFEVVVPRASGGLAHYWRDASTGWHGPTNFASGRIYETVSLIGLLRTVRSDDRSCPDNSARRHAASRLLLGARIPR